MEQPGAKRQMGGHRFQMGAGHHWPPAGDGPDVNRDHPRTLVKKAQRNQLGFVVH